MNPRVYVALGDVNGRVTSVVHSKSNAGRGPVGVLHESETNDGIPTRACFL